MTFFIVTRKKDGAVFPEVKKGYSWVELDDCRDTGTPPRLFTTARGAANALTLWLQGGFRRTQRQVAMDDFVDDIVPIKQDGRGERSDYEIVPVQVCRMQRAEDNG